MNKHGNAVKDDGENNEIVEVKRPDSPNDQV